MNPKPHHIALNAAFLITALVLSGCGGITMSPVKRALLKVDGYHSGLKPDEHHLLVKFESTIPNQPVSSTVWDNVTGPFIDEAESRQIGYTQDYGRLANGTVIAGMAGGIVVGMSPDYTRIVIPFGRIFENEFHSGLTQAFPRSCMTAECGEDNAKLPDSRYDVTVKILEFKVWEQPTNHINLVAKIECKTARPGSGDKHESIYLASKQLEKQSIGSMLSTSQGFIQSMNEISNRFASDLAEDILSNLQKEIKD